MNTEIRLQEGQVLTGPQFNEPMLVETVRSNGSGVWSVGLVGQRSEQFRRVTLTADDVANLHIAEQVREEILEILQLAEEGKPVPSATGCMW